MTKIEVHGLEFAPPALRDAIERVIQNFNLNATDPDTQVKALIERYRAYASPCPFKPGDLVTPRANSSLIGAGQPHIVLEVDAAAEPYMTGEIADTGSQRFGFRPQIRVMALSGDALCAWWNEHHEYEPYRGPTPSRLDA